MTGVIKIRGARENNLKNIDLDIPKNKLVVFTGVSGSGKSSLAFNTIYAEGQRRYVESLSSYARQFLDMQKKPDVDLIEGLAPAISIEQKTTSKNPRSTVGTVTEIYDYLRLLWARIGVPHSPVTGLPIKSQTIPEMVDWTMKIPAGTKIFIMAPLVRERKGEYKKEIAFLVKQGYQRAIIDNELYDLSAVPALDKNKKHSIFVIVDRLQMPSENANENDVEEFRSRMYSDFEGALRLVPGSVLVRRLDTNEDILYSQNYACPVSGFTVPKIEPRLFSFNAPMGACTACDGLGVQLNMSPDLVIPDPSKSILDGAIAPWSRGGMLSQFDHLLDALHKKYKIPLSKPWHTLTQQQKDIILYGSGDEPIKINWNGFVYEKPYEGVIPNIERRWRESDSEAVRAELAKYQSEKPCPICHGKRLNIQALCVKIYGLDIMDACDMAVDQSLVWFTDLPNHLTQKENDIARVILREITSRLQFLKNVGLGYLTLSRMSGTLSGGEAQRIRLASQIGSGLSGVLYVLDEPSIGLHQSDNDKLLDTLKMLRDKDNTVIVVEHDEDAMRAADYLVDIGPGAGINGGHVVAAGTPEQVIKNKDSLTGQYLSGKRKIDVPKKRRVGNGHVISVQGARENNLKNINVDFPLGEFVALTGVSGSGKSTLLLDTLYPALMRALYNSKISVGAHDVIRGMENVDKVVDIDQSPIGRTPRSNPATYTGVFSNIRDFFAGLPEAKARGYGPGRFSFNVKGGRCEACQGDGQIKIEMNFLADVYVECDKCHGARYNDETLAVKYKGKSIADVLNMTVEEAYRFFSNVPQIARKLELLKRVGLDYIKLGQSSLDLSGGEAQRIKLSKELAARSTGQTIYILDEPTTGLHFADIKLLLSVLHELVDQGNTVIVIEHNLEVIKTADWIIDLGPGGGANGGRVVATGTPEQVAENPESLTGKYLKKYLDNAKK
ncbi:MAG TPA: excinuclease ABC subunit UvrA [Candidatus Enterousia avicola]|uniref:UvrABC system protein A n=1 Tax=Candidatus Enterousia avicola TaxID=2840787 RepID=A0A9D1MSG4_9PROT|nr:excinuclease ABC subunit UvrA [Candidatus Enterousia avicola]